MTDPSSWPPPPNISNLLAAHDDFLMACIRDPALLSRLRLVRDLRLETGQSLGYCLPVVNDFCDRHLILMPVGRVWLWLTVVPVIAYLVAITLWLIGQYILSKDQNEATTHLQKLAFRGERDHLNLVLIGVMLTFVTWLGIAVVCRYQKAKADAAEAIAKFA